MSDSNRHAETTKFVDRATEAIIKPTDIPLSSNPEQISRTELEEAHRRSVLLYQLGRQICAENEEDRVFGTVLSAAVSLLNVERAFVASQSLGRLVPRATHEIELSGNPRNWPVSKTMLRRALDDGISVLATDAQHDASYGLAPSVDLHNIRSVICCPLGTRQSPLGLLYVDNRMRAGAFRQSDLEFLHALCSYGSLAIQNAQEHGRIAREKELAEARLDALRGETAVDHNIVGASQGMIEIYDQAKRAARKDVPVLLVGETGTGKEVLARFIHRASPRANGPFIAVNVGALSQTLVESELFGHEKGAFTGADQKRIGRFELAQGGTLFLDEVQDIPRDVQSKFLRVLEERSFERVGGNKSIPADVRTVAASNKSLSDCVAEGSFRPDLLYRLNSVMFEIPLLRERREDIVPLVYHFLKSCRSEKAFSDQALEALRDYSWPGNVRELRNCVEAIDALVDGDIVHVSELPKRLRRPADSLESGQSMAPLAEVISCVEREHMARALEIAGGNSQEAIRILGISRTTFFHRKKKYGL